MTDDLTIDIPTDEWIAAAELIRFAWGDERSVTGMLHLTVVEGRRRWCATDSYRLALRFGEPDDRSYEVLVSPRLIDTAVRTGRALGSATLRLQRLPSGTLDASVAADGAGLRVAGDERSFPDIAAIVAEVTNGPTASAEIDAEELRDLVRRARWRPVENDPETADPLFWLSVGDGRLSVQIDWPDLGFTEHVLPAITTGDAARAVSPAYLAEALEVVDGPLVLRVPSDSGQAIDVRDDSTRVLIMPIETSFENRRADIERLIADVFGRDATLRDHDGDYPIDLRSTPIYARLVPDDPVCVQVFAVVLAGVEATPDLLTELNDHNAQLRFVRTFWADGAVMVESDIVADTADPDELRTAYRRVRSVAEELSPMLAALHGGELVADQTRSARWAGYMQARIATEVVAGTWTELVGPDAIDELPYPVPAFVITAHNPMGTSRPPEQNDEANRELAKELIDLGVTFDRALAGNPDPENRHIEESFVVWELDREDACALGQRFGQDAIFELDAESVSIVSCVDDRVTNAPRRWA